MHEPNIAGRTLYRVVLDDREAAGLRALIVAANGPEEALLALDRVDCRREGRTGHGRYAILENERLMVRVLPLAGGGGWVINPPTLFTSA